MSEEFVHEVSDFWFRGYIVAELDVEIWLCAYFSSFNKFLFEVVSELKEFSIKFKSNFGVSELLCKCIEELNSGVFVLNSEITSGSVSNAKINAFQQWNSFKQLSKGLIIDFESDNASLISQDNNVSFQDLNWSEDIPLGLSLSLFDNSRAIGDCVLPVVGLSKVSLGLGIIIVVHEWFRVSVDSHADWPSDFSDLEDHDPLMTSTPVYLVEFIFLGW